MSNINNKPENVSHAAGEWSNSLSDSLRDFAGLQFRTAQFAVEKSVSFGQSVTDFYQNQLNESIKLSQEYAKYGWGLTDNLKKTAFEATDRVVRGFNT